MIIFHNIIVFTVVLNNNKKSAALVSIRDLFKKNINIYLPNLRFLIVDNTFDN